jgi:hypothetical protein
VGDRPLKLPRARAELPPLYGGEPWVDELLDALGGGADLRHPRNGERDRGGAGDGADRRRLAGPGSGASMPRLRLHEDPGCALPPQGYRLRVDESGIELAAAGRAGLIHGAATLRQWIALHAAPPAGAPEALTPIEIEDWPDFRDRGVMLDVSRNKVPTLATLRDVVDRLASWKINQLQLYTEHTFAYDGHEEVWRGASPLTAADVRALDDYCAGRGIDLVPNQNSFGHLHRWLVHHPYRRLAECPEGVVHPWSGGRPEPFSLCPVDPDSLRLLEELYDQLLPCFRSGWFNVGLDETFDLGLGRSRAACEARGRGRVYLDFLRAIHARVSAWDRRMMFWGDIALEHPELLPEVPRDALALVWGYEASHPFDDACRTLAAAGLDSYVCPGTSSWLSFAGRWRNALHNIAAAARAGVEHGARGLLVTDWGDRGHLQPLPISYPGLLAAACFAWSADAARDPEAWPAVEMLDRWALPGLAAGRTLVELGNAYRETGRELVNSTVPFHLFFGGADPMSKRGFDRLDAAALGATSRLVESIVAATAAAPAPGAAADGVRRELIWSGDAVGVGCDLGRARLEHGAHESAMELPASVRQAIAARIDDLIETRRELWLKRHRPGGLDASLDRMKVARDQLAAR